MARLPHQHRGHARTRGLRRRSRARAVDGRLRPAARRRGRRPDAADPFRHAEGLRARPRADRRREQDRPTRGAPGLGREPDLRSVRSPRRERAPARFPDRLYVGAPGHRRLCPEYDDRRHDAALRDDHRALPGAGRGCRRPLAAPGQPARLLELCRLDRHRPHSPRDAPPCDAGRRHRSRRRGAKRAHRPGVRFHGPRARGSRGSTRRRHRRVLGSRGAEDLRHDLRSRHGRGAARARRGRTDDQHDVRDEYLAAVRPGRQVRHEPAAPRAAIARDACERGAPRRGDGRPGPLYRVRPRRTAPRHPDREHAPRGLRTRRFAAARRREGRGRRTPRALGTADGRRRIDGPGRRHGSPRRRAGPSSSTWCRTARAACGSTTRFRRAA